MVAMSRMTQCILALSRSCGGAFMKLGVTGVPRMLRSAPPLGGVVRC